MGHFKRRASDAEGAIASYSWTSSALASTLTGAQPSSMFNTAGTYTVTVTDSKGCTDTDNILITEPDPLFIITTHTNIQCFGDAAT